MSYVWTGGKQDDAEIARAEAVVRAAYGPDVDVRREPFLLIDRDGDDPPAVRTDVPLHVIDGGRFLIKHPDLCIVGGPDGLTPLLIVEVDGAYHDSTAGRKSTDRRNGAYTSAGIPFVAVRTSEYGDDWPEALRDALPSTLKSAQGPGAP